MPRGHRLYLDDILEAIGNIREYVKKIDYDAFARDKKTRDAVLRSLEIIGEAAGRGFDRMLWLNPSDNQGVRALIRPVKAGITWEKGRDA